MSILDRFKKTNEQTQKGSVAAQVTQASEVAVKEKTTAKPKKAAVKSSDRSLSAFASRTILAPVVSEKTAHMSDRNIMVFHVAADANRITVRQALNELYKVRPLKVNIINTRGKAVRFGKTKGKRSDVKKAIVTLPKGTRIDVFEGV